MFPKRSGVKSIRIRKSVNQRIYNRFYPDETGESLTEYQIELTVSNQEYVTAMSNTSSDEFIGTAVTFCEAVSLKRKLRATGKLNCNQSSE